MAKLLIVDDEASVRGVLKLRFEKAGHQVIEAGDGEEGLALAKKNLPNLILLDIMMPKMDGLEVCLRLKSDPQTKHIPVVMITAYDQDIERIHRGRETVAADAYYSKTWAQDELEKIANILLQSKMTGS
jgi:CheY-like chemotaxis protein